MVEDFLKHRLRRMPQIGEANFICCPKCKSETWAIQCFSDGKAPFVNALVCISEHCDGNTVITVENGVIETGDFLI